MSVVVYKLGGSLLLLPDLPRRIAHIPDWFPGSRPLIVVGGGQTADVVREWDRIHHLGDERAHQLALSSLRLNEMLLVELVENARRVCSRDEVDRAWADNRLPVLSTDDFLRANEASSNIPLPHNWNVTSDSIAAWVALEWPADKLVLLKSRPVPTGFPAVECPGLAVEADLSPVDAYFAQLTPRLAEVDWVNLRDESPQPRLWGQPTETSPKPVQTHSPSHP